MRSAEQRLRERGEFTVPKRNLGTEKVRHHVNAHVFAFSEVLAPVVTAKISHDSEQGIKVIRHGTAAAVEVNSVTVLADVQVRVAAKRFELWKILRRGSSRENQQGPAQQCQSVHLFLLCFIFRARLWREWNVKLATPCDQASLAHPYTPRPTPYFVPLREVRAKHILLPVCSVIKPRKSLLINGIGNVR